MNHAFGQTTWRTVPPFRYDVVGSFLRPSALQNAREQYRRGEITAQALQTVEDASIRELVKKEKAAGLLAVTDGEFRRSWWHLDFMWGLEGVEKIQIAQGYQFHAMETRAESARVCGKVAFGEHPFLAHYAFLKAVAGDDVFARQTIPAPAQLFSELTRGDNRAAMKQHYAHTEDLIQDIAQAYRDAIQAFYRLGCRNLQMDDCTWGAFCDQGFLKMCAEQGIDTHQNAEFYARINNLALVGRPADMAITMHVCRGNYRSTWASSGGYEPVAEVLFGKTQVDGFYLEFDSERAGGFEPLRFTNTQQVVLGLVSSKTGALEDKGEILHRIEEATRYVDINRLCLSPQCGFASTEEGNALTEAQQWAKIALVREIACEIWKF